ncbi:MAG: S16 family serine protease [Candidatus Jordarchaeaceae archaeon]
MNNQYYDNFYVKILSLCLVTNVFFAFLSFYGLWQLAELQVHYNNLLNSYVNLEKQMNLTKSQLDYYKAQANYYSSIITSNNASTGIIGHIRIPIVAVKSVQIGFNKEYQGIVMTADVELQAGSGRILIDTVPRIGIDIQTSVRTAVKVAENVTGVSLGKTDVILTIMANQDVDVVDGPSAGAAITVALIAAIRHQNLNATVYITGTIGNEGNIGVVGGVLEKALAAAQNGARLFLIPKGQSNIVVYVPKVSNPFPGWTLITYEHKVINLQSYLTEAGYAVTIAEVETIYQAYDMFLE